MTTAIGIRWYPRKEETLLRSIETIGHDYTVYPDGQTLPLLYDVKSKLIGEHAGCFKHYYRVIEDLCKQDVDIVGSFPDDIIYSKGWLDIALRQFRANPYVGYLDCFTALGLAHGKGWRNKKGWQELKGGWGESWGGAYLFRKDVALKWLKHPFILNHLENYKPNQQIDAAIPEAIHQMGLFQFYHIPSLVKHIGMTSTIGHKHRRMDDAVGW
tara:strand:- start:8541 stop:9179 length:639 start_codon:yes stop_codon:yes gene_type:complete